MASHLPIPAPPRTPTPPPEDDHLPGERLSGLGLEGFLISPARSTFDPRSLSPMDENFSPGRRYGGSMATNGGLLSSNPLSPTDTNSLYSAMSIESSPGSHPGNASIENSGKGMFNFQPTVLAQSPVSKSVVSPHSQVGRLSQATLANLYDFLIC